MHNACDFRIQKNQQIEKMCLIYYPPGCTAYTPKIPLAMPMKFTRLTVSNVY